MGAVFMDVLEEAMRVLKEVLKALEPFMVIGGSVGLAVFFSPLWIFGGDEMVRWMRAAPLFDLDPSDLRAAA